MHIEKHYCYFISIFYSENEILIGIIINENGIYFFFLLEENGIYFLRAKDALFYVGGEFYFIDFYGVSNFYFIFNFFW